MADLGCEYVLTTPSGTITFNDGSEQQFYIQGINGLGTAPIRAPIDDVPFGDGSLGHNFWKAGRHIDIEGTFLITNLVCPSPAIIAAWNVMEEALRVALESIAGLTTAVGTLAWTPSGLTARSLTVRHDVPMECPPDQNFMLRNFTFGLFAEDPDW